MKHPVIALIWESWRLSRRWYLLVLLASFYIGWLIFYTSPVPFQNSREHFLTLGNPAFTFTSAIACLSTLLTITMGRKNGFPFSFEYRLPISTFTLVTVPMFFLGILCASLYFIPLGLYRIILDIPFPLLPGTVLVITMSVIILCGTWITTSYKSRSVAITFAILFSLLLLYWFNPLNINFQPNSNLGRPQFNPDIVALDGVEYLILIFVSAFLLGLTVTLVSKLRLGEASRQGLAGDQSVNFFGRGAEDSDNAFSISTLVEILADKFVFACPVARPWQAEIWHECKRYMLPVLLLSLTFTVLVPVMTRFAAVTDKSAVVAITGLSPFAIFFIGIGLSLFNRRNGKAGYMNAFEGTRGMSTMQLASIQLLGVAISTAIGITLVRASLALSQPLAGALRDPFIELVSLPGPIPGASFLLALNNQVMGALIYVGIIALFFCLHSCAIFWGRKFLAITMLLALNALSLTLRIRQDEALLQTFIILMWCISIILDLVTLIILMRLFRLQIVSVRTGMVLILGSMVIAVCGYFNLEARGYDFSRMPAEFLSLNITILLLPLTLAALTLWCYDRLRHG